MPRTYVVNLPKWQPNLAKFSVEVGQPVQHIFLGTDENKDRVKLGNKFKFKCDNEVVAICEVTDSTVFLMGMDSRAKDWLATEMGLTEDDLNEKNPKFKGVKINDLDLTDFNTRWYIEFYKYFKKLYSKKPEWNKAYTDCIMTWMNRID